MDAGGTEALGNLPGFNHLSIGGVSADGSVIVWTSRLITGSDAEPFIWTEAQEMVSLSEMLADNGVELESWNLRLATGISDDGNSIVGWGANHEGVEEGWLIRLAPVPEPSSKVLLATVLFGLLACRIHRQTQAAPRTVIIESRHFMPDHSRSS